MSRLSMGLVAAAMLSLSVSATPKIDIRSHPVELAKMIRQSHAIIKSHPLYQVRRSFVAEQSNSSNSSNSTTTTSMAPSSNTSAPSNSTGSMGGNSTGNSTGNSSGFGSGSGSAPFWSSAPTLDATAFVFCDQSVAAQGTQLFTDCPNVASAFFNLTFGDYQDDTVRPGLETTCQDACVTRTINLFNNNQDCLDPALVSMVGIGQALCNKTGTDGKTCGYKLSIASPNCMGRMSQTACGNAAGACTWNSTSNKCGNKVLDADTLKLGCDDACMDAYLDAASGYLGDDFVSGMYDAMDLVCMQIDDQFCYPTLTAMGNLNFPSTAADATAMAQKACASDFSAQCFNRMVSSMGDKVVNKAKDNFVGCFGDAKDDQTKGSCLRELKSIMDGANSLSRLGDIMCARANIDDGDYCLAKMLAAGADNATQACSTTATVNNTCTDACDKTLNATMSTLGCCGYFINQFIAPEPPLEADLPGGLGASWALLKLKDPEPMGPLNACPTIKANAANWTARCQVAPADAPVKELTTELSYDDLKSNGMLDAVQEALAGDIATSMGVDRATIDGVTLTSDPNTTVVIETKASSRRQTGTKKATTTRAPGKVTKRNATATKMKFSIRGASGKRTEKATGSFDKTATKGNFKTTGTAAALKKCTTCKSSGGGSLLKKMSASQVGITSPNAVANSTNTTRKSAPAMVGVAAVVMAVLALMA